MRKYYLFLIRKDFCNIYRKNAQTLYLTLDNIYRLKNQNFTYGISIYNQLCQTFDIDIITNYFNNKNRKYIKQYHNKFFVDDVLAKQKSCIQLNRSCVILKTNCNMPYVLQVFKWYSENIFVCDFNNSDYFWLNDYANNLARYEYCL